MICKNISFFGQVRGCGIKGERTTGHWPLATGHSMVFLAGVIFLLATQSVQGQGQAGASIGGSGLGGGGSLAGSGLGGGSLGGMFGGGSSSTGGIFGGSALTSGFFGSGGNVGSTSFGTNQNRTFSRNNQGTMNRPGGSSLGLAGTGQLFSGVSSSNILGSYYANPVALGMPAGTTQTAFGSPIYANLTTGTSLGTSGTLGSGVRGISGTLGSGFSGGSSTLGYGTTGYSPYGTLGGSGTYGGSTGFGSRIGAGSGNQWVNPYVMSWEAKPSPFNRPSAAPVGKLYGEVRSVLDRSTSLPSRGNIQLRMNGPGLILEGTVADERERRLAEGLVRLTPGVREVENRLQVRGAP